MTETAAPAPVERTRLNLPRLMEHVEVVMRRERLTNRQVARATGLLDSTMTDLRRNGRMPSLDTALALLAFLHADVSLYLLAEPAEPAPAKPAKTPAAPAAPEPAGADGLAA